jgi:fatty acyl-CoA reductase
VSTAYSNADKSEILEIVYPPPANPEHVIQCCQTLDDDILEAVAQRLQGKHPNTYTLTKAMAEWVVAQHADIPAAIVRPSIGMKTRITQLVCIRNRTFITTTTTLSVHLI